MADVPARYRTGSGEPIPGSVGPHRGVLRLAQASHAHLRIFMEFMELERRVRRLDASAFAGIRQLIEMQGLGDAPLAVQESPAPDVQIAVSDRATVACAGAAPAPQVAAHTRFLPNRRWVIAGAIAAGCAAIVFVAYYFPSRPQIYSTQIGEQQRQMLQDGSIVQLNTNSQVEVNFSRKVRAIRLIRGEAFFDSQTRFHLLAVRSHRSRYFAARTRY